MTKDDRQLLEALAANANGGQEWNRPMDLGAWDSSGHSARLKRLSDKGLVERQRRNSICNVLHASTRGSYQYRITDAGREALSVAEACDSASAAEAGTGK